MFYFSWKDSGITIIAIVVNVLSSCSSGSWLSTLASEMHRFIFAICTTPPRRRNWSTNPWTTPTNRDEMICTNTHYNSQKVRRHGAMSWRSEKYTSHAGKQTDVYRWSKHLTANWCYLMMFLPTWWWPSWPSWYIQGHPERMRKENGFNGQGLKAQWRRQVLRMSPKGMGKRFLVCLMMKSEWKGLYYELMWRKVLEEWVRTICKRNRMWVVDEVIWSTLGPAVQVRWWWWGSWWDGESPFWWWSN